MISRLLFCYCFAQGTNIFVKKRGYIKVCVDESSEIRAAAFLLKCRLLTCAFRIHFPMYKSLRHMRFFHSCLTGTSSPSTACVLWRRVGRDTIWNTKRVCQRGKYSAVLLKPKWFTKHTLTFFRWAPWFCKHKSDTSRRRWRVRLRTSRCTGPLRSRTCGTGLLLLSSNPLWPTSHSVTPPLYLLSRWYWCWLTLFPDNTGQRTPAWCWLHTRTRQSWCRSLQKFDWVRQDRERTTDIKTYRMCETEWKQNHLMEVKSKRSVIWRIAVNTCNNNTVVSVSTVYDHSYKCLLYMLSLNHVNQIV